MEFTLCWPTTPGPGACPGMWLPRDAPSQKISLSQQVFMANGSLAGAGLCIHLPFSVLGFCLVAAVRVLCVRSRCLCVHMCTRAVVSEALFLRIRLPPTVFQPSLQHRSLSLERTGLMKTSPLVLTDPEFLTFCMLSSCGSLC